MTATTSELHGHWILAEPYLSYDPTDTNQVAVNPLVGLRDHGPFSSRLPPAQRRTCESPCWLRPMTSRS